jgi:DNA-binding CsgD family transcriptional regulator
MYINFVTELLNERFSKNLKNVFFVFWGIFVFVYMFVAGRFFVTGDTSFLKEIWAATYLCEGIILMVATSYLLKRARSITDKNRRKAMLSIGLMYFLILVFYAVLFLRVIKPTFNVFLVLHFSYNIPPLIYLNMYLKKHHTEVTLPSIKAGNLDNFFNEHNITQREREVILLLLKGKRTKDIEKELFISYHTVKNHIHNIYQKLNVQNRIQITSLIRDHLDKSQQ